MNNQLFRQTISAFIFSGSLLLAQGQVLITPQIPPTGLMRKDQLWNIVLVCNNEIAQDIQLQVSMMDINTGQKVLTASSRLLTITKGARQLQITDLSPVQYNYTSAEFADRNNNGLLPVGNYQVCYTLIDQTGKNSLPAQEDCVPVEILPLSPPQLNAPFNSDTITTRYPLFQWIPPAPLTMFNNLNYEFVLVTVNKGQNRYDAVQKNTPIYFQSRISNLFLPYPSSGKALEEGMTYAWQVTAKNESNYTEKTEIWSFTVSDAVKLPGIRASGFPRLQEGTGALFYVFNERLQFAYTNLTNDTLVTMQIYSEKSPGAGIVYKKMLHVSAGENLVQDDIINKRIFREDELYRLEIADARGSKWGILFKCIKRAE